MLIESLIQRPHGTSITLGHGADAVNYHFTAGQDGRHVCEVVNQAHAAQLLEIRDGFGAANPGDMIVLIDAQSDLLDSSLPFFIVRGPQDLDAFAHWVASVEDMQAEVVENVLLIDKISVGDASLGGYAPAADFGLSLFDRTSSSPAPALSPRELATNTILPDRQDTHAADVEHVAGGADLGVGAGGADNAGAASGTGEGDGDGDGTGEGDGELDREGLAKEYDEIFGHRPNGRWSAQKISETIADHKANG